MNLNRNSIERQPAVSGNTIEHLAIKAALQYRHLISAPDDQTSFSAWLYKHLDNIKNEPSTLMTQVACESKLCPVMTCYPCPGNWLAIEHAVMYYAQAAHVFSAGIKCWHCSRYSKFNSIGPLVSIH